MTPIPVLSPGAAFRADASTSAIVGSQPIIQLKELVVDRVRYDCWKASLREEKVKRQRRKG